MQQTPAPPPHNTHMCTHSISPLHPSIHSLPPSPAVRGLKHLSQNSTAALKREKARKRKNKRTRRRRRRKITTFVPVIIWIVFFVCFLQRFQSVPLTCVHINHVGRLSSLRSFFYKYIYMIPFSHSLSSSSTSLLFSHPSSLVSNHSRSLFLHHLPLTPLPPPPHSPFPPTIHYTSVSLKPDGKSSSA